MWGTMASAVEAMHAGPIGWIAAQGALSITPAPNLRDVGAALAWMLVMAVYVFLYFLVLLAPFVVIYHVLRVLLKGAARAGILPRSRQ